MALGVPEEPVKPKIPETVPLEKADQDRKQLYGPLVDMNQKLNMEGDPPEDSAEDYPSTAAEAASEESEELPDVDDHDKQMFVRALLGDKPFEKTYTLFGKIDVILRDRTALQTEQIYEQVEKTDVRTDTPEAFQLWLERFQLACNLRCISQPGLSKKDYPETDKLYERLQALLELPKPLFQAALQANRDFELLVAYLTDQAQSSDFWPAGGSTSRPARTSPAPSTSAPATAGRVGA